MYTEPAELPGSNSLPGPIHRTIVLFVPPAAWDKPRFAWSLACCGLLLRTIAWVLPRSPGSPEARTRTICTGPQAQHAKKGPSSSPSPDTPNNSPTPSPRIPASPRKRSYMPDYGFIYYLLLSQPHHLMLALRFSFFALPYA